MSFRRSIVSTFLVQAPTLLLYFASSTLLTRMLSDVGRGQYALFTSQTALLAMLIGLNLGFGTTFFTARANRPQKEVIGAAASMLVLQALFLPLVLLGISATDRLSGLLMPQGYTSWVYWIYVYLTVVLSLLIGCISALLLGLKRFRMLNRMNIVNAALNAGAAIGLYAFRSRFDAANVLPLVLMVTSVALVAQAVLWIMIYIREIGISPIPVFSRKVLAPILSFSVVGYATNLINLINYRFDIWVIGDHLGNAALGLYSVAVGTAQLLFYIPDPFSRVAQPYLFGQVKNEMLGSFKVVSRLNFTTVLLIGLLMGVTAPWIVPALFGQEFGASITALWLLLPGILFSSASKLFAPLLIHGGKQNTNLYWITIAAVMTIVLDMWLIPYGGIEAAALITTAVYLLILVGMLLTIRIGMGIPVHDLFLLKPGDIARVGRLIQPQSNPVPRVDPTPAPQNGPHVLCVVGWWPTGTDVSGIFIKEHLLAIARNTRLTVVYMQVTKDTVTWPSVTVDSGMEDGLLVHRVRIRTPLRRFDLTGRLARLAFGRSIAKWHAETPFDLVHVHVRTDITAAVTPVAKRLSLPVVVTEHNSHYHLGIKALPSKEQRQERLSIRKWFAGTEIKCVLPVSHDLARVLVDDFGLSPEKVHVVRNVAAEVFRPAPRPLSPPFRITLAAVWRPPKDHDVFIRALGSAPPGLLSQCRIDWVGYGPDYETIRKRCREELPNVDVHFPGYLNKTHLAELMRNSHLFVLPTTADNLPCVVIESLCCGTPVVSMAVNGVPELIDSSNGILVPPSDPIALAAALTKALTDLERFDRRAIAANAARNYSVMAINQRHAEIYRAVLNEI